MASTYLGICGDSWDKMFKLVSLCLETQADRTLHFREFAASLTVGIASCAEMARTRKEGTGQVLRKVTFSSLNYHIIYNY
jgi:hypothetical protein